MGKNIISWSPVHGQSATTSNIASLASVFSLNYHTSNLITHTQLTFSSLESLFGKELIAEGFEDSGVVALERLAKSDLLKPEAVMDYTETIFKNRLDILGGSSKKSNSAEQDKLMQLLLSVTNQAYDQVWIDAHSGTRNQLTNHLLANADLVLVNLPQNRFVLDRFFSGEDFPEILNNKNYIVLISSYDKDSSFNIRKIKRRYKIKHPIFPIHYSHHYKDAANQLSLAEFFYRNRDISKDSPVYSFINSLNQVNKYIAKQTGFSRSEEEDE